MTAFRSLLALTACLAVACHAGHEHRHDAALGRHRAAAETEIRRVLTSFEYAERSRDPDALIAFLADDFQMLQDGRRVDRAATVAQMRATLPTLRAFTPRFDDIRVIALDRDTALTSLIFHDDLVDATGQRLRMWGPSTMLWRRRAGSWQMVFADSDHYPEADG